MANTTTEETRSVNIASKVTPSEAELIRAAAEASGLTGSDWCRKTLLGALSCSDETRLILTEMISLRKLALWFQVQTNRGVALTEEVVKECVAEADRTKAAAADKRIAEYFASKVEAEAEDEAEENEAP